MRRLLFRADNKGKHRPSITDALRITGNGTAFADAALLFGSFMPLQTARRGPIWNNLPLRLKGLLLLSVPLPALMLSAMLVSGTLREERQALTSAERLASARQRLQDISAVLLVPCDPAQDYRALATLAKDLRAISADPQRLQEIQTVIQLKLESLGVLTAAETPDESSIRKDRDLTKCLQSYVAALAMEYDRSLSSELNRAKTAHAKLAPMVLRSTAMCAACELLAALVFLGALTSQVRILQTNSRRLAQGEPLLSLPTDNWEIHQIACNLNDASAVLARRPERIETTVAPPSEAPGHDRSPAILQLADTLATQAEGTPVLVPHGKNDTEA